MRLSDRHVSLPRSLVGLCPFFPFFDIMHCFCRDLLILLVAHVRHERVRLPLCACRRNSCIEIFFDSKNVIQFFSEFYHKICCSKNCRTGNQLRLVDKMALERFPNSQSLPIIISDFQIFPDSSNNLRAKFGHNH